MKGGLRAEAEQLRHRLAELERLGGADGNGPSVPDQRLPELLDGCPVAALVSLEGRIEYINQAAIRALRVESAGDLLGRPVSELVHPEHRDAVDERLRTALQTHSATPVLSELFVSGSGAPIDVEVTAWPVPYRRATALIMTFLDVTARKESEELLRRRDEELQLVLNSAPAFIAYLDRECRYVRVNRAYEEWFGLRAEDIHGKTIRDAFGDEYFKALEPHLERVLAGQRVEFESRARRPNGEERHMLVTYSPKRTESGEVGGFIALIQDLTDRKMTEERLRQLTLQMHRRVSEFEALLHTMPVGIQIAHDPECSRITFNRQIENWLSAGGSSGSRSYRILRAGRDLAPEERPLQKAVREKQPVRNEELEVLLPDGRAISVFGDAVPPLDEQGNVRGGLSAMVDITARKKAEDVLRSTEHQLRLLVDASAALLASPHSAEVLRTIVDLAERFVEADCHAVWQYSEGFWRLKLASGLSESFTTGASAFARDPGSFPLSQPFVAEDIAREPLLSGRHDVLLREGIRSVLVIPLRIHGDPTGTLVFYWKQPHKVSEPELRIASALGNLAASALGTAQMYEQQIALRGQAEAAERRSAFLADAGALLASSLDYEATLTSVSRLAVPMFADWAAVDILDDAGAVQRVSVTHSDPEKVQFAYEMSRRYPPRDADMARTVLRSGQAVLAADISDDSIDGMARDAEHARMIRAMGLRSAILVPMRSGEASLGVITFATAESGRRYTGADLKTAEELARRAAAAVAHARLYRDIRNREERYRSLVSASTATVWTCDPDGRFVAPQPSWEAFTGQTWSEARDFGWLDAVHPADRGSVEAAWLVGRQSGVPWQTEGRLRNAATGEYRYSAARAAPVRDESGAIREWVGTVIDVHERRRAEEERAELLQLEKQARETAELLNRVGGVLAAELDLDRLNQSVTDIATRLAGAQFGALFSNDRSEEEQPFRFHAISGFPGEPFRHFSPVRDTALFAPTFREARIVRCDDVRTDRRLCSNAPSFAMPQGQVGIRSYLAVPVVSRSGEVLAALVFGHEEPGRFTEQHERLIAGVAGQAAVALDNARLFSESVTARQMVERTNADLRRANEDLEQFAYSASHDLQEPLRMVSIYSQLLQRRYEGRLDSAADQFLGYTIRGARRMEMLVRDLLTYTRTVAVREEVVEPVDASEVLSATLENLKTALDESEAHVESERLPMLLVEQIHLLQLFQNLVGNSLKYRSEIPPVIQVSARRSGTLWEFRITDNGLGISPAYAQLIFGIFRRLHTSEEYEGTGIGLAICQKIVERYGGKIWVESKGDGQGSTFCFTLPGVEASDSPQADRH